MRAEYQQRIGRNIKQLRQDRGMTQATFGAALEPPRTHAAVSDIERGRTQFTVTLLKQVGEILEIDPRSLFEEALRPQPVDHAAVRLGLLRRIAQWNDELGGVILPRDLWREIEEEVGRDG